MNREWVSAMFLLGTWHFPSSGREAEQSFQESYGAGVTKRELRAQPEGRARLDSSGFQSRLFQKGDPERELASCRTPESFVKSSEVDWINVI